MRISDWSSDVCSSDLLGARVAAEHPEVALERSQPEHRLERGGLAGAIGADQADDLAAFDPEVGVVERDGGLVCLAQVARGDDVFMRGDGVHAASPPKPGFNRSSIDRSEARLVGTECVSTGRSTG